MGRQPVNVLVFPFRKNENGEYEYAILKRADMGFWQGVSGGLEEGEELSTAASRESFEEAGIPITNPLYKLTTIATVPANKFRASLEWGPKVHTIFQYYFAVEVTDPELILSREHTEYKWASFDEAEKMLLWDTDKTGLYELNNRLLIDDMELC